MQETLNLDQTPPLHKTSVMQSVIFPQDLRVGNIVASGFMNPTPTGLQKWYNPCEVKAIGIEKIIVTEKIGRKALEKHDYSNIKPVILNVFWLEKLGFEKVYDGNYKRYQINLLKTNIYLRPSLDKWYFGFINNGQDCEINDCYELEFVHEIQNLIFSLTRVSLTVA